MCSYATKAEKKEKIKWNAHVKCAFNVATADREETSRMQNKAITHSKKVI